VRRGTAIDRVAHWGTNAIVALLVVFLFLPAIVVVFASFSDGKVIRFPPREWGFAQYEHLFASQEWLDAVGTSFKVGIPTAIIACLIGTLAVYAIARTRLPGAGGLYFAGLIGLIAPASAYAVAMYGIFVKLHLLGSVFGLVLAHAVLAVPIVLLVVRAGIARIPIELELAAMSLGASRLRAWLGVTGRLLVPTLVAALVLAFLTSFDEAVFSSFLGGADVTTLPRAIFNSVRFGVDPVITAIATLLMLMTALLVVGTLLLRKEEGGR